jgi:hypothetical protein
LLPATLYVALQSTFFGAPSAGVTVPPPFQSPLSWSNGLTAFGAAASPGAAKAAERRSAASGMALQRGDENQLDPMGKDVASPLLSADTRTRSADVGHHNAGKTSRIELRSDEVGLKSCLCWNPVGTNGLPERNSLHQVSG